MKSFLLSKIFVGVATVGALGASQVVTASGSEDLSPQTLSVGFADRSIDLQVLPLSIKSSAEVMAVKTGRFGMRALIFTGRAAKRVATAGGFVVDTGSQMVVATGRGVRRFFKSENLTQVPRRGTKAVFFMTRKIDDAAISVVTTSAQAGVTVVRAGGAGVLKVLSTAVNGSVTVVSETGSVVVTAGRTIVGTTARGACTILRTLSFGVLCHR